MYFFQISLFDGCACESYRLRTKSCAPCMQISLTVLLRPGKTPEAPLLCFCFITNKKILGAPMLVMAAKRSLLAVAATLIVLRVHGFTPPPHHRACPSHDGPWVEASGRTCVTVASLSEWRDVAPMDICRTPFWRYGKASAPAVLGDHGHALAVAALLPAGTAAWVALSVQVGPAAQLEWQWDATSSSYGLSDPGAWAGARVPSPLAGLCAVLGSDGLLQDLPCNGAGASVGAMALNFTACALPSCNCSSASSCNSSRVDVVWQSGGVKDILGYACAPLEQTRAFHIAAVTDGLSPSPDSTGACNFTIPPGGVPSLSLWPGEDIRLCGFMLDGSGPLQHVVASMRTPSVFRRFDEATVACSGAPAGACMSTFDSESSVARALARARLRQVIAVSDYHQCVILARPYGAVRCWGTSYLPFTDAGQADVPSDLPPAAFIAAGTYSTCAVTVGPETPLARLRCWGDLGLNVPYVDGLDAVHSVAVAAQQACVIGFVGTVQCWGATGNWAPSVSEAVGKSAAVVAAAVGLEDGPACAIDAFTLQVRCWGLMLPRQTDLESPALWGDIKAYAICMGSYLHCIIVAGTGEVMCKTFHQQSRTGPWSPGQVLQGIPPALDITCSSHTVCAVAASTRSAHCIVFKVFDPLTSNGTLDQVRTSFDGPVECVGVSMTVACAVLAVSGRVHCWETGSGYAYGGIAEVLSLPSTVQAVAPSALTHRGIFYPPQAPTGHFILGDYVDMASSAPLDVAGIDWLGASEQGVVAQDVLLLRKRRATPGSRPFLRHVFSNGFGLEAPSLYIYTQQDGVSAPVRELCHSVEPLSTLAMRCTSPQLVYGVTVQTWNGTDFERHAFGRAGDVFLLNATSSASPASVRAPAAAMDTDALAAVLASRTGAAGLPSVLVVRAGDVVSLNGRAFGLHAVLAEDVPWWRPRGPRDLRSCIHLAWWASSSVYHNDSACECNGQEDWLGEGELPRSAIVSWEDSSVSFLVPTGEGVREIRLCIEGRGLLAQPPRSTSSIYVAYEPPRLAALSPAAYVESTESDTPLTLHMSVVTGGDPAFLRTWGTCSVQGVSVSAQGAAARLMLPVPVPSNASFALHRHCLATPAVRDSLGRCYTPATSTDAVCGSGRASLLPPPVDVQYSLGGAQEFLVSLPDPAPKAVVSVTLTSSVWDSGLQLVAGTAAAISFRRSLPALRAVAPNPLLLGGDSDGDERGGGALLTLYGAGLRTAEELDDARNGLQGYDREVSVLIDGVPCRNATVKRPPGSLSFIQCAYPAAVLPGGVHEVTLTALNTTTALRAGDGTVAALVTRCAPNFYGLFGPGHQLCMPCPRGATCAGGIAQPPVAARGWWNLGLPAGSKGGNGSSSEAWHTTGVVSLSGARCPVGQEDGGRGIACILPCEPSEACVGANGCAEGYESVPPAWRCAACSQGFYRNTGVCVRCPSATAAEILLGVLCFVAVGALLWLLSTNAIKLQGVQTTVEHAQLLTLLHSPTIPWPQSVQKALDRISVLRLNTEAFSPECFSGGAYATLGLAPEARLLMLLSLPLLLLAAAALAYVGIAAAKSACTSSTRIGACRKWRARLLERRSLWSHGPPLARLTLKCWGLLFLPVLKACIDVFNCLPTSPPDGHEYLSSIAFEECGLPGGLQERMKPFAVSGLVLYGACYPAALALFFWLHSEAIVKEQLLRVAEMGKAGMGKTADGQGEAWLGSYAGPLFADYKPGYQHAAFIPMGRSVLVLLCYLVLNKSAILQAAAVSAVLVLSLVATALLRPLLTPGAGDRQVLAQWSMRLACAAPNSAHAKLRAFLQQVASDTGSEPLLRVCEGTYTLPPGDVSASAWLVALDLNGLQAELQIQILLAALLSIMYNSAAGTVYEQRTTSAVTGAFFSLLSVAVVHVLAVVGADMAHQLLSLARQRLEIDALAIELQRAVPGAAALSPGLLLFYLRQRWSLDSATARTMTAEQAKQGLRAVQAAEQKAPDWTANPLQTPAQPVPMPAAAVPSAGGAASVTLDSLRARAGGPSMALTALRRRHTGVTVCPTELAALPCAPSALTLEDWEQVRSSYSALWAAVEADRRSAHSKEQRLGAELEALKKQLQAVGVSTV